VLKKLEKKRKTKNMRARFTFVKFLYANGWSKEVGQQLALLKQEWINCSEP
jgi:hypothetical protein